MTIVKKLDTSMGTPFLSRKLLLEKGLRTVTIETEPGYEEVEFTDKATGKVTVSTKMTCEARTNIADPNKVKWQMNATTSNYLIDKLGEDTAKWVNQEIELAVKKAGSAEPGVYPKDCSLEQVMT